MSTTIKRNARGDEIPTVRRADDGAVRVFWKVDTESHPDVHVLADGTVIVNFLGTDENRLHMRIDVDGEVTVRRGSVITTVAVERPETDLASATAPADTDD